MMRTTVRYKGFHCDWVVLRGGVSSRHSVLRFLFCIMSSCSSSRHPVSPLRLAIPSRLCVSSCIVSSCRLVCVGPWGGTILAGRPLCHLVISSSPLRRPASFVSFCDAWGETTSAVSLSRLASIPFRRSHVSSLSAVSPCCLDGRGSLAFFVPCRRASCVVSFSHSLRSFPFAFAHLSSSS